MSIGRVEGSPIPLMMPNRPVADELAKATQAPALPKLDAAAAAGKSFMDLVAEASQLGHHANLMAKDIAEGRSDDIHGTMIEVSKAGIETRLAVNVKDKIIDAFYELWRMSI